MAKPRRKLDVYLEIGSTRVFAGARDWPGWARSGKEERTALGALFESGPRYARALQRTDLGFVAPADGAAFAVRERLKGNATTDFGAPDVPIAGDQRPLTGKELGRQLEILEACWRAFDAAVKAAKGKRLRLGPRGGGRDLERMLEHVVGAEQGYLGALGVKFRSDQPPAKMVGSLRKAILEGLAASGRREIPAIGPRGGKRWTARFFIRRAAWHALDHAWEIEDRIL